MSWYVLIKYGVTPVPGYLFQAPDLKAAQAQGVKTNSAVMADQGYPSKPAAIAAAKAADVVLSNGGGSPAPPPSGGGNKGGGNSGGSSGGFEVDIKILSKTGQWWVVNTSPTATADTLTVYTVCEGTQAQALALPNGGGISGPYDSEAKAIQVANGEPRNAPVHVGPIKINPNGGTSLDASAGLQQIGSFFSTLSQASTWIRVAEVAIGILLLGIGIARITGAQNIVSKIANAKVLPV